MAEQTSRPLLLAIPIAIAFAAGCGGHGGTPPRSDGGPIADARPGGGASMWGGVAFPWKVFDGTVPDVPVASGSGHTWYCDPVKGNDAWDGTSFTFVSGTQGPKQTAGAALANPALAAGDTILLGGGIYRERLDFGGMAGTPGSPITIGSYGHGTGAPILDGGIKPGAWTHYGAAGQTRVWQTSTSGLPKLGPSVPVLGIYVNNGTAEAALREVPHGQLSPYGCDTLPPNETQADLKDGSNDWYFDPAAQVLYADFGGTLGAGDPNTADVSILYNSENGPSGHEPLIIINQGSDYLSFIGLTLRAASWTGVYSEASHSTFDHCDAKFNGGAGIEFGNASGDEGVTGNAVTNTRIWMNVLHNWPRFNNGNVTGGWPGGLSWGNQSNVLAQGDVVYQNGGEGLILGGTDSSGGTAHTSVNNEVEDNIVYDNFSVNIYLDNTQGARIEQNFVFAHPFDPGQTFANLLTLSPGYGTDWDKRLVPANLSLGDEPGSSYDGAAHSSNITVLNNIFAGGGFGFVDYDDGTTGQFHGLKNDLIANNTWVLGNGVIPGADNYGWRHLDLGGNPDASSASFFENNLIGVAAATDSFEQAGLAGAGPGITDDYNLCSGPGAWKDVGTVQDFATWKSSHPWDAHSASTDAKLVDATEFSQTATQKPVYDWSKATPASSSPALGAGTAESGFDTDFTGAKRAAGANDVGAISRH